MLRARRGRVERSVQEKHDRHENEWLKFFKNRFRVFRVFLGHFKRQAKKI